MSINVKLLSYYSKSSSFFRENMTCINLKCNLIKEQLHMSHAQYQSNYIYWSTDRWLQCHSIMRSHFCLFICLFVFVFVFVCFCFFCGRIKTRPIWKWRRDLSTTFDSHCKVCRRYLYMYIYMLIPPYIRMLSSDWLMKGVFFFTNSSFFQLFHHCRDICISRNWGYFPHKYSSYLN